MKVYTIIQMLLTTVKEELRQYYLVGCGGNINYHRQWLRPVKYCFDAWKSFGQTPPGPSKHDKTFISCGCIPVSTGNMVKLIVRFKIHDSEEFTVCILKQH